MLSMLMAAPGSGYNGLSVYISQRYTNNSFICSSPMNEQKRPLTTSAFCPRNTGPVDCGPAYGELVDGKPGQLQELMPKGTAEDSVNTAFDTKNQSAPYLKVNRCLQSDESP